MSILLLIALVSPLQIAAGAQSKENANMDKVRVRYLVNSLNPAVRFYTTYLGFQVERESKPNFAMLERGHLELVLSTPFGPEGAAKPMSDGRRLGTVIQHLRSKPFSMTLPTQPAWAPLNCVAAS